MCSRAMAAAMTSSARCSVRGSLALVSATVAGSGVRVGRGIVSDLNETTRTFELWFRFQSDSTSSPRVRVLHRRIHFLAVHVGGFDFGSQDFRRGHLVEVAIDEDEVGIVAGDQLALVRLR